MAASTSSTSTVSTTLQLRPVHLTHILVALVVYASLVIASYIDFMSGGTILNPTYLAGIWIVVGLASAYFISQINITSSGIQESTQAASAPASPSGVVSYYPFGVTHVLIAFIVYAALDMLTYIAFMSGTSPILSPETLALAWIVVGVASGYYISTIDITPTSISMATGAQSTTPVPLPSSSTTVPIPGTGASVAVSPPTLPPVS